MTKVLVFGTFDGLHEGHLDFFKQAREFGDPSTSSGQVCLVVVVGRDSSVAKLKKRPPRYNEQERLKKVQECNLVDEALLGEENHSPYSDSYNLIKEINPDVICLGYDQSEFLKKLREELKKMNLKAEVKVLKPHKPEIYKSSVLNN